ncbi:MAG: hypothetical protein ACKVJX_02960 [Verrucomicrobiia bacterium]
MESFAHARNAGILPASGRMRVFRNKAARRRPVVSKRIVRALIARVCPKSSATACRVNERLPDLFPQGFDFMFQQGSDSMLREGALPAINTKGLLDRVNRDFLAHVKIEDLKMQGIAGSFDAAAIR